MPRHVFLLPHGPSASWGSFFHPHLFRCSSASRTPAHCTVCRGGSAALSGHGVNDIGSRSVLGHEHTARSGGSPSSSNRLRPRRMVRVGGAVGLEGMTLFCDPDAITVSEWDIHPDAHPCIALSAVSYDTPLKRTTLSRWIALHRLFVCTWVRFSPWSCRDEQGIYVHQNMLLFLETLVVSLKACYKAETF